VGGRRGKKHQAAVKGKGKAGGEKNKIYMTREEASNRCCKEVWSKEEVGKSI